MADVAIGILGLNRIGTSIGLALQRYNAQKREHQFTITGYDTTPDNVNAAKKMGALHEATNKPEQAAQGRDIIIMAMPFADAEATYQYVAPDLRRGAVILDFSPLSAAALAWGEKHLREDVHVVSVRPVVNPHYLFEGTDTTERATEDYFDNGTFLLMPSVSCVKDAIQLAAEFSRIVGSSHHFVDPAEHDGLMISSEVLPSLMGIVYFHMMAQNPGWSDLQRMTNPTFGMMTRHLYDTHPDDLRDLYLHSSDTLVRFMDVMLEQLRETRNAIARGDRDALESLIVKASEEYEAFYNKRYNNNWRQDEATNNARGLNFGTIMNTWLGFGGGKRDKDDE